MYGDKLHLGFREPKQISLMVVYGEKIGANFERLTLHLCYSNSFFHVRFLLQLVLDVGNLPKIDMYFIHFSISSHQNINLEGQVCLVQLQNVDPKFSFKNLRKLKGTVAPFP